jgi:flavin reductase (DIM6/NTAB) family NADH-FMN oxidoreductase RutF
VSDPPQKVSLSVDDLFGLKFWPALPSALVTTIDAEGTPNVAFMSLVAMQSYANIGPDGSPPSDKLITLAIGDYESPENRRAKRTYTNILETGDFVVSFPSSKQVRQAHATVLPGIDKFAASGLTPEPSSMVDSPSIAECRLAFECDLVKVDDPGVMAEVIWGKVVAARIDQALLEFHEDELLEALDPIYNYSYAPREGTYHRIGPRMRLDAE